MTDPNGAQRLPSTGDKQASSTGTVEEPKDDVIDYEVRFDANDTENPFNWSRKRRWYITFVAGLLGVNATFGSSAPTGIVPAMMEYFGFGVTVASLTIALFVAGYSIGPIVWGPLSEHLGRKKPLLFSFTAYTAFSVGCALSRNTASILILRFLSGVFSASGLVITGAIMSDMWDATTRGKAIALFTLAPFAGPTLAPTIGGFIATSGASWRWLYWVTSIFAGVCALLVLFTVPETYTPVLLIWKAKKLRAETGDNNYYAPLERKQETFRETAERIVATPFILLIFEPMLLVLTLYMSFIYGVVYLLFEAYPVVFLVGHGFSAGVSGLMFLPILVGSCLAIVGYLLIWSPRYESLVQEFAPHPVPPEYRLQQAMWAAPIFTPAFFWFGWTSYPSVSFWAPMMSGGILGFSMVWIFLALYSYVIDSYLRLAASALAANTIVRSAFGAAFPLFATDMYNSLNPRWASTLLGLLALVMMPIPAVLFKFGPALREKSRFAVKPSPVVVSVKHKTGDTVSSV